MNRIVFLLVAVATVAGVDASRARGSGQANGEAAPIFGIKIYPGYRDWRLISVAYEEGNLNGLELCPVRGKRQSLWPSPILRPRPAPGLVPSVYGQELEKVRCHGWVAVRSIR
jgi:hypothetical protein